MQDRLTLRRRRSLGEIVSDSFAFWTRNWKVYAAVVAPAVLVTIIFSLINLLITPDFDRYSDVDFENLTDEETRQLIEDLARDFVPLVVVTLLSLPVTWVFYQLTSAGVVVVLSANGEGREMSSGDALDAAQDRVKDLLIASLKSTVIILLWTCTIVGIPIAIKRAIQWSLTIQSIMLDDVKGGASLAHSAELVKGNWWYTLGRLIVAGLVLGIPAYLASSLLTGAIPGVVGVILGGCVGFFSLPYPIIATTLIFYHQKQIKAAPPVQAPPPPPIFGEGPAET